ncbi:CBS domain-containing protein [Aeoliella mucimassa]|uniref:Putative voltage-gated ClC-type chloride channel ClcB n=1 Tax=Aeoliella mucimassa TaxID=2527972 RepID=A0A518AVQ3_9BACT|nr:CBS domain-containing protein [Aeoliella mucimassa]QDU58793.1 putative voltage-gated ClC-type chloride channel ClcB [Aeoliella mucimassa]
MNSKVAKDIMVTRLVTLRPTVDVLDAVRTLLKSRISGAPVVDADGKFLGVFSEKCAMQVILDATYDSLPTNNVGAFMDTQARQIRPDTDLLSIAQVFLLTNFRRLAVVDEQGYLLGQISRRDVMAAGLKMLDDTNIEKHEPSLLYLSALHERKSMPLA